MSKLDEQLEKWRTEKTNVRFSVVGDKPDEWVQGSIVQFDDESIWVAADSRGIIFMRANLASIWIR